MSYLVGDIGGTHVRLRLTDLVGGQWRTLAEHRSLTAESDSLAEAVRKFLDALPPPQRARLEGACLAVAGPVDQGRASLTNRAWQFDEAGLASALGVKFVGIVNDFAAVALALPALPAEDVRRVRSGVPSGDMHVAIGPGTGLGQVVFRQHGHDVDVFPSEGGHSAFAPLDAAQDELLAHLRKQQGRVSYECLLSGRGLTRLHRFHRRRHGLPDEADAREDAAAEVVLAIAHGEPAAVDAVKMFWSILGAYAGDAVLTHVARAGVHLAGGILPRLPPALGHDEFLRAFAAKGAMTSLVERVPVRLALSDDIGLRGAEAWLSRRLREGSPDARRDAADAGANQPSW